MAMKLNHAAGGDRRSGGHRCRPYGPDPCQGSQFEPVRSRSTSPGCGIPAAEWSIDRDEDPRPGGTLDISRWCNHRTCVRAILRAPAGALDRWELNRTLDFSNHALLHLHLGRRPGAGSFNDPSSAIGGARCSGPHNRWFHHRLISNVPPGTRILL